MVSKNALDATRKKLSSVLAASLDWVHFHTLHLQYIFLTTARVAQDTIANQGVALSMGVDRQSDELQAMPDIWHRT